MKKSVLLLIALWLALPGYAQDYKLPIDAAGNVTYTNIQAIPGPKDSIFGKIQSWIAQSFGSYKAVVQFESLDAGKIVLNGMTPFNEGDFKDLNFKMTMDVKDGKYRCIAEDIQASLYVAGSVFLKWEPVSSAYYGIAEQQHAIDSITSVMSTSKNKRQLKEDQKNLADAKKYLANCTQFCIKVNAILNGLFASLKTTAGRNDNF